MECHHITGGADFLIKVATKDIQAYEQFIINTLTVLPNVQNLKTLVVLSTLKHQTKNSRWRQIMIDLEKKYKPQDVNHWIKVGQKMVAEHQLRIERTKKLEI